MAFKVNNRGSFIIKKSFKRIGEIRRASGSKDEKTFIEIQRMMQKLYDTGKHSILEEIRDGVVSGLEVYRYHLEGRLDHLPSAATLRPVLPTVTDWIDTHSVTPYTRQNYKNQVKRFCAVTDDANLSIQDVPAALKRYKLHCSKKGIERTFNACRVALLAYFNRNFGRSHILYQQVSDIRMLKLTPKKKSPHLSVSEFHDLTRKLPEPYANIVRAMVTTGMHFKEIAGEWWTEKDRIVIKGTKAVGRDRVVPLIQPIHHPTRAEGALRRQLKKVRKDLTPNVFRKTYVHWLELAGVPRSRRRMYMGHTGVRDTTDIYESHQVDSFLREDTEVIRKWIIEQWKTRDEPDGWEPPSKLNLL